MSVVEELIRKDDKGTLSFGNYLLSTKTKKSDFQYESVPGSAVTNFKGNKEVVEFDVEALGDIGFTLEMEPSQEYKLVVNGVSAGRIPTNVGGKLNASLELDEGQTVSVKIVKC